MSVDGATVRDGAPPAGSEGERWHLLDERDFLLRSLQDAAREHDAGDLSDDDHAVLVARDAARLAAVEAELAAHGPVGPPGVDAPAEEPDTPGSAATPRAPDAGRPPLTRWRKIGIAASLLLIALGVGILVTHFVQSRTPGQPSSGSVSLSQAQQIEQQLQQAVTLNNEGDSKGALELYDKVLSEDPSNPAALAYAGFLQWNIGTSAHVPSLVRVGRSMIETAVRLAPSYSEAHLFDGLVLENQDHDHRGAVAQFDDFLADGPPSAEPAKVAPLVAGAYQAAGVPLPAAFSAGATSSSNPAGAG